MTGQLDTLSFDVLLRKANLHLVKALEALQVKDHDKLVLERADQNLSLLLGVNKFTPLNLMLHKLFDL